MPHKPRFNPVYVGLIAAGTILVVMVAIIVSGIPGGPGLGLPWNHTMTVKAELSDADALAPKAGVQIAGVKIGEVRNVDIKNNVAVVTMDVQPQYSDLHTDSRVLLRPHGLFGPKYIELQPGTSQAPLLHDGDTIPGTQAVLPVDLDQVLHELQAPERASVRTAIVELGQAAAGRGSDFNHLVAAGNTLTSVLDQPVKTLSSVSGNLSDYLVKDEAFNASFSQAPLDQLVANSNKALGAFAQSSANLASLLKHADSTLTTLDTALRGQSGNLRSILETLPSTIDKYNQFNDALSVFGLNFAGKDGSTSVLPDLPNAILNPKSASGAWDPCTYPTDQGCSPPPNDANPASTTPRQGRRYYIRVQSFNEAPTLPSQICNNNLGLPLSLPLCPPATSSSASSKHASTSTSNQGTPDLASWSSSELLTFGVLLGS
jgi:virulence factor Mce-like protein